MEIITKEGKELDALLQEVCEELNVSKDDFYYKSLEKKNGLFSKSNIELKVILKEDLLKYIKDFLEELINNMGLTANFESKIRENTLYIKIYSNNNPVLIGKGGNTLKSLETIVKQKINTEFNIYPYISLDVENYKEKQERRLIKMARNLAKEVTKTNMEVHLDNMNAYERRIIHNALTNFKGVLTTSVGEEPERHIIIKPE